MKKDEDMSNTFVAEVGQKSAIFKNADEIESLDNETKTAFPEVKIDPPSEMPSALEEKKEETANKKENQEEDEEFLEAKKKKKSKKYRKRNPFVMFLIIVICLALGAGTSYYYFEVYTDDTKKEETTVTKTEVEDKTESESKEIKPTSLFIKKLINDYDYSSITNAEIYSTLYAQEKTTIKDLDETYLRTLAAIKANRSLGTAIFSSEDFQNAVTILFGNQITLEDESISIYNGCTKVEYQNSYYYATTGDCGGASAYSLVRKIVKAVKNNDTLEVNVAAAITDGNKIYKEYDNINGGTDELTDIVYASFDIDKDYTKLNQYKYTFNYDSENDNYYLTTIELIK